MTDNVENKLDSPLLLITLKNGFPIQIPVKEDFSLHSATLTSKAVGFFCDGQIMIPWDFISHMILAPKGATLSAGPIHSDEDSPLPGEKPLAKGLN